MENLYLKGKEDKKKRELWKRVICVKLLECVMVVLFCLVEDLFFFF